MLNRRGMIMAYEMTIAGTPTRAKVRNPWGVLALSLVTLGIYQCFWWYFVNRELRDLGRANEVSELGDNPALSALANGLGAFTLYVTTVWTFVAGTKRVQRAQVLVGQDDTLNGWLMLLIAVFTCGLGCVVYFQSELNKVWHRIGQVPPVHAGPVALGAANTDLQRIQKLAELRDSGALTSEEFEAEKARVIPQMHSPLLSASEQAQARLRERQWARQLARQNPVLAREMGLGRPDLADGADVGLIDVNNAPAAVLAKLPDIDDALAGQIITTRSQIRGFSSVEELGVALDLPGDVVEDLRDRIIFLPH